MDATLTHAIQTFHGMDLNLYGVASSLLKNAGLEYYHTYFRAYNQSSYLPYHNEYHMLCMVINCYEGAYHEKVEDSDLRSLLVAATFHDFDHSGGRYNDGYNIHCAIRGLTEAQNAALSYGFNTALTPQEFDNTVDAIRITKYPYEDKPSTLIQKIIRDADLMQVYEQYDRRLCKQYRGLQEEVEILHGRKYTNEEWAYGCADFNRAVVWHTNWAKKKAIILDHATCTEKLKHLLLGYK